MGNILPQLPGQRIASTRRRLVGRQPQGYGIVTDDDGSIWFQPFGPNGGVYSYPARNADATDVNQGNRAFWIGSYGFLAMAVAIASYSMWDLLIMLTLSVGESELELNSVFYSIGFGISGINGWLAGYLLARLISKRRTWASLGGLMVLQSYVSQWWKGAVAVSHICHFTTMGQGFIAGLALEHFGPKQKPWKFVRKHIGKIVLAIMVGYMALGPYLKKILPDPPGFEDPHDPEVAKATQAKFEETLRLHAEQYQREVAADLAEWDAFDTASARLATKYGRNKRLRRV